MPSQAKSLIILLIFWGVLGLIWAALYDTINTTLPNNFPTAAADGTWTLLTYIWFIGMPILAVGTGLSALNQRNQYSFGHALMTNGLVFIVWLLILIAWSALYTPFLTTIPEAMNAAWNYTPGDIAWIKTLYNSAAILMMLGFGVIGVIDAA